MRDQRARYRILAAVMLPIGLMMIARTANKNLIVTTLLLVILCAVASLRWRDYS
jgi:hypothetical protein